MTELLNEYPPYCGKSEPSSPKTIKPLFPAAHGALARQPVYYV